MSRVWDAIKQVERERAGGSQQRTAATDEMEGPTRTGYPDIVRRYRQKHGLSPHGAQQGRSVGGSAATGTDRTRRS